MGVDQLAGRQTIRVRENSRRLQRNPRFVFPQILGEGRQSLLVSRGGVEIGSKLQEDIRLPVGLLNGTGEEQGILL